MTLTNAAIKNARPRQKPYKLSDGRGMYLLVNKTGKYFRLDYRFLGKRRTLALGVYPIVILAEARKKREEAKKLIAQGIDPVQYKRDAKALQKGEAANSFETVAREWFANIKHTWSETHSSKTIRQLESNIFPWLGPKPISSINAPGLLSALRRIEDRGAVDTAHRIKQTCGQIFRYAIATGRAERDPSADLKGALKPVRSRHMAAITDPQQVGGLLRAIDGYQGHTITRSALRLAPLLFVRPGELRKAEWSEIDFDQAEWRIPAEKMKSRTMHIVPLAKQTRAVLKEIRPLTGRSKYVFPSFRTGRRPMSNNTVLAALRRMGYSKDEMTGHGFRAMASTILHEQGWPSDVIERQLAHAERNSIKAAYNHAQHLPERRKMMQHWADYLDKIKNSDNKKIR